MERGTVIALLLVGSVLGGSASAQPAVSPPPVLDEQIEQGLGELPPPGEELAFGQAIPLFDPSGRALLPLHRSMRRAEAGEGQVRVLVFGASHVAADIFTNSLRGDLQSRFGNAGHGLILPVRPRGYHHRGGINVENSRRWEAFRVTATSREVETLGLAGIAVEASASTEWGRIDTGSQTASRFEVYYMRQPGGGSFDVFLDGRPVRRVNTGSDETGAGYALVSTADARHTLELRLRGDGRVRFFGVSVEREVPGVIVDTLGLNGARAVAQLLWEERVHQEQLRRVAPDLVVLAYGTNESGDDDQPIDTYETNLRRVVARVRGTVPGSSCLLIGPSDRPMRQPDGTWADRPRTHQVIDVQRRVARDFGCAFFDLVSFGGGPMHMVQWAANRPPYAQADHIHFTARGYLRLGEVLYNALMAGFDEVPRYRPPR